MSQVVVPVSLQYSGIIKQKSNNIEINYISFDGAQNHNEFGAFPVYYYEIERPNIFFECEIEIEEISSSTLSSAQSYSLTDNDLVEKSYNYKFIYSGNKVQIYVLPFKWDELHNQIVMLEEFKLFVNFVPIQVTKSDPITQKEYASQSVLKSGSWIKMGIVNTGIHKLTYHDIEAMGLNPQELNINNIGIFGNYNGVLPESNSKPSIDDLSENSIFISGKEDNSFDQNDYILFYAQAPTTWTYVNNPFGNDFTHHNNIYTDTTYYFFTPDRGTAKPITNVDGNVLQANRFVSTFVDNVVHERNLVNLLSSGKKWYGENFSGDTLEREFVFNFPNINPNAPVTLDIDIVGRALSSSYYNLLANDVVLLDSIKFRAITPSLGIAARASSKRVTFSVDDDEIIVKVKYYSEDANAGAWLDFITLNADRYLVFDGGQMNFRNTSSVGEGNISQFTIQNANNSSTVWDISDIHNPKNILYTAGADDVRYSLTTDTLKSFVVFDNSNFYSPVSYVDIPNQNLHEISDVNFVIISPDLFAVEAEKLANIHRQHDDLTTICVTPQQIYNEYSSGSQDITAIRNFMKMLYDKGAFGGQRSYLLLFGDASFDYKHRIHNNTNLVPTYQANESLRETGSFVTDDYYGLLDNNEGGEVSGNLDVGIGRFPISTNNEAISAVNKIESYLQRNDTVMRDWRTKLCFVGDDQDNNLHFIQAQGLTSIADTLHKGIAINKIYLDAYRPVKYPSGYKFPEVNNAINKQIESGALIVNYTGHGGVLGWSEESVLDIPMINSFQNKNNLPLIITATCEFSRFDDPELTSAGEYFFLNQNGGAIALLTTTRLAYAHANYVVNRRIYNNLLKTANGNTPRLGDLVRLSKIPSSNNYLNFVLLGDPALTLAYPEYDIITTEEINNNTGINDTIHALSIVTVTGKIFDDKGVFASNFNGYVYPKTMDKASSYTTLGSIGNSYPANFKFFDKLLFDGKAVVINGKFEFEFAVPKDISYNYGYGRIRYYALDTIAYIDAWGGFDEMYIGGIDENAVIDNIGPDIELYLNENTFVSGSMVNANPVMLSYISDENGINSTGSGVGRNITATIDDDYANTIILNDYYQMDMNSYKSGKVVFPFSNLTEGNHTLTIKAWDLQNNSNEKTISFFVNSNMEIKLTNVLNYPNPFVKETIFKFKHNKNGALMEAIISIYNINGEFITQLNTNLSGNTNAGFITWYGTNSNGSIVAPGIYIYTVELKDSFGNVTVQQQKLFKVNE